MQVIKMVINLDNVPGEVWTPLQNAQYVNHLVDNRKTYSYFGDNDPKISDIYGIIEVLECYNCYIKHFENRVKLLEQLFIKVAGAESSEVQELYFSNIQDIKNSVKS